MKILLLMVGVTMFFGCANTIKNQACATYNTSSTERQGCCSKHSGVCGCSSGRAVCCDGTLSPSCRCY